MWHHYCRYGSTVSADHATPAGPKGTDDQAKQEMSSWLDLGPFMQLQLCLAMKLHNIDVRRYLHVKLTCFGIRCAEMSVPYL